MPGLGTDGILDGSGCRRGLSVDCRGNRPSDGKRNGKDCIMPHQVIPNRQWTWPADDPTLFSIMSIWRGKRRSVRGPVSAMPPPLSTRRLGDLELGECPGVGRVRLGFCVKSEFSTIGGRCHLELTEHLIIDVYDLGPPLQRQP